MSLSIGCRCDFWPMVGCNWVYLVHMFHNPAHLVVACWGWGPPGCEARVWSTVVIKIVVWSFVVRFCQSVCLLLLSTLSLIVCKPVYLQSVPPLGVPPTPPEQARSPPQTLFPQPGHPPNTIPKMMHFRMSLSIGCRCDFSLFETIFEPNMAPSWAHFGAMLGTFWDILGCCFGILT